MKKIEAIVQPHQKNKVMSALTAVEVNGMTVSDVFGHGRQKGHKEIYRGQEYDVKLLPKVKFEIVVPDDLVDDVVSAIEQSARTGEVGDGKIFVSDVVESVRIRNGDRGDGAL